VAQLSEWLQIMLAEIGRKQEEALRSAEEQQRRANAPVAPSAPAASTPPAATIAPMPGAAASASKRIAAV
jgi:hypothetical protein